jgi:D-methionine transport system ATP-binding protein
MIRIENLSKTYQGSRGEIVALHDIDLAIERGEIFGIIGRSGAGKSTLVRCINLLERPSAGRIRVADQELTALTNGELRTARRNIGMIFQHFNLLSSRTVFDNIALPLELAGMPEAEIEMRVAPLLDLVGLAEQRERYPSQLSGGQKQRVGIARALAHRPHVLLCDEATSALDPETTRAILALLRDINHRLQLTVIVITHEMTVVKDLCDRVAVLDHGCVVEQGSVFDVFSAPAHETTRALIRDVTGDELPAGLRRRLAASAEGNGRLLRLSFADSAGDAPLISALTKRFDLDLNILHGQIDEIQGRPFGSLLIQLDGAASSIDAAIRWLGEHEVRVEPVAAIEAEEHADVA